VIALVGFTWLFFIFLFLSFHGILDICFRIIGKIGFPLSQQGAGILVVTVTVICSGILFYGWFEADLQIAHVELETDKFPQRIDRVKITQISDVHFNGIRDIYTAEKIAEIIELLNHNIFLNGLINLIDQLIAHLLGKENIAFQIGWGIGETDVFKIRFFESGGGYQCIGFFFGEQEVSSSPAVNRPNHSNVVQTG
jgi:hypothetical protein